MHILRVHAYSPGPYSPSACRWERVHASSENACIDSCEPPAAQTKLELRARHRRVPVLVDEGDAEGGGSPRHGAAQPLALQSSLGELRLGRREAEEQRGATHILVVDEHLGLEAAGGVRLPMERVAPILMVHHLRVHRVSLRRRRLLRPPQYLVLAAGDRLGGFPLRLLGLQADLCAARVAVVAHLVASVQRHRASVLLTCAHHPSHGSTLDSRRLGVGGARDNDEAKGRAWERHCLLPQPHVHEVLSGEANRVADPVYLV